MDSALLIRGSPNIECCYPNTVHGYLLTPAWESLAAMTGDDFILYILTLPMFIKTLNGCFVQVAHYITYVSYYMG